MAAGDDAALRLINEFRKESGRAALAMDARLVRAAERHAREMVTDDFFDHKGPGGSTMDSRAREAGYEWRLLAENLAAGMGTPEKAIQTWIDSKPHRHNLLLRDVVHAGIAHLRDGSDSGDIVFGDYWVLLLAAPSTAN